MEYLSGLAGTAGVGAELEVWQLLLDRYAQSGLPTEVPAEADAAPADAKGGFRWDRRYEPPLSRRSLIFFCFTALVLYLRLIYRGTYFPPFFEGEEAKVLDLAKDTCDFAVYMHSWYQAVIGGLIEYNKGYHWLLVPFYLAFGYDERLVTYILPAVFGILCATFFTIYRKTYPKSSLLSFIVVIMFSVLCLALRRYKWHSVAYITAIASYLYFLPEYYKGRFFLSDGWRKVVVVFLCALSCYLYFGCLVYSGPIVVLVVFFSTKKQRRAELAVGGAALAAFAALFAIYYKTSYWKVRVGEELRSISQDLSHDGMVKVWGSLRDFFFTMDLTVPFLIIFVVGIVSSFRRIARGDRFALVNTTLFLPIWIFVSLIGGLNNPDQLNWLMLPFLGVLLTGADEILCALRDKVRYGTLIGIVLVAATGWNEMRHYPTLCNETPFQSHAHDRNTRAQIALILRSIRDDNSGSVRYYLPAPALTEQQGGYDYAPMLPRVDYYDAFLKVTYFMDQADLRRKLTVEKDGKRAVVYMSVGFPGPGENDTLDMPVLGQKPVIVHPYEDIYQLQYLVRKYEFSTGPSAASLPLSPDTPPPKKES